MIAGGGEPAREDRLRLWREERARVAEAGRQERIGRRQAEAEEARQAAARARRTEAEHLLPDAAEIGEARRLLAERLDAARRGFLLRLLFCVLLPTALWALYLAFAMTPLYEARTIIAVGRGESAAAGPAGWLPGPFRDAAPLGEAFKAQTFINSMALMDALERETGVVSLLSGAAMDPLSRLRDVPLLGISKQHLFGRYVRSSIDIQTGLVTIHVRAPGEELARDISGQVVALTAAQIAGLADALEAGRQDAAQAGVEQARRALREAQANVLRLQLQSGEVDPAARVASVLSTIRELGSEAEELQNRIEEADVAGIGDSFQAERLRSRAGLLAARIDAQRRRLVDPQPGGGAPLNAVLHRYQLAMLEFRIAEEALTLAEQTADTLRREAALARPVLQVVVPTGIGTEPAVPNVARGTALAGIVLLALLGGLRLLLARR